MPVALEPLVDPAHTALVLQECQVGVIGEASPLPALAAAAATMIPNLVSITQRARSLGVPVMHCTGERRGDGRGANSNARIFRYMATTPTPLTRGTKAASVLPEIGLDETDFHLPRLHGLSPFAGSALEPLLRNMGVRTVVIVGVSVNVAIQNAVFDAVNTGFQAVLPRDAVAGWPQDYVDAVFENTLNAVATVTTTGELLTAWGHKQGDG